MTPPHERYARHLALAGFGADAQHRLANARVLVVGAGGLGSPVLAYLAAAGVGSIDVIDDDVVSLSNLQRQVLFGEGDVGRFKVDIASDRLRDLNPLVAVTTHATRITTANVTALVATVDLVIDCADNFPTRYFLNDACVAAGVPCVWASVHEFSGQVAVWAAPAGPCYRCVHPEAPPEGTFASCAEAGVLGAVCAVVGGIQATEAIKMLTGVGEPLVGRLLAYDALSSESTLIDVRRDSGCPACGTASAPSIAAAVDARVPRLPAEIDVMALRELMSQGVPVSVIDCREGHERRAGFIDGARHIPLAQIRARPLDVDRLENIVVYCAVGVRSAIAVRALEEAGIRAASLRGGWSAWAATASPTNHPTP